ncbi:GntR family transcriptional regulator [Paraliobacillus salinarum]|uniref:GntR family transcriptional regulator n=1 Tax=Paraliobacillus salinarum TaxID=1158996 RepID=UPI0015F43B58|nr:GntR family transcriptional regulator [Paraliobacillus salinarum]
MKKKQSLHAYIKEELVERIKSSVYKVGDKFPTENELCDEFQVSRTTVRSALNQLTMEGYLVRQRGKGSFVAEPKVHQTLSATTYGYDEQLKSQGKKGEITLKSMDVVPATGNRKRVFNLEENDPIQKIKRIRKANNEIIQYEIAYIPWEVAPAISKKDVERSLYRSLQEHYQVEIAKTTELLEIVLTDKDTSNYLECEIGLPCFYIETVAEDKNGRVIEFSKSYFRGDKTNFKIERHYSSNN